MRVLAFLPDDSLSALKRALNNADAIGVDPSSFTAAEWAHIRKSPALAQAPVLFYARLDQASVQRVVEASGAGVHEVMLREIDDDALAIRRRLETLLRPPAPAQVLSRIAPRIIALPPALQGTILSLFCAAPIPRWADEVARLSSMSRRSVDRWLEFAELAGTASVLDVARLARVWTPLVEQKIPAADVAARGGYRRLRMLALHARKIVGASPTLFSQQLTEAAFVDRLTRHVVRA